MSNVTIRTGKLLHYKPSRNSQIPVTNFPRSNRLTNTAEDRIATSMPHTTHLGEYTGNEFETDVLDNDGNPISFPKRHIGQTVFAGTQYTILDEPYIVEKDMPREKFLALCDSQLETLREIIPITIKLETLATRSIAA